MVTVGREEELQCLGEPKGKEIMLSILTKVLCNLILSSLRCRCLSFLFILLPFAHPLFFFSSIFLPCASGQFEPRVHNQSRNHHTLY